MLFCQIWNVLLKHVELNKIRYFNINFLILFCPFFFLICKFRFYIISQVYFTALTLWEQYFFSTIFLMLLNQKLPEFMFCDILTFWNIDLLALFDRKTDFKLSESICGGQLYFPSNTIWHCVFYTNANQIYIKFIFIYATKSEWYCRITLYWCKWVHKGQGSRKPDLFNTIELIMKGKLDLHGKQFTFKVLFDKYIIRKILLMAYIFCLDNVYIW